MTTTKIPIVFAFDDYYALPASIAIQSLVDAKKPETEYDIIVFHGGLSSATIAKMNAIAPIRWLKVDAQKFMNCPQGWSGRETYYRLLIADLLPEYDKVIWSDVDVLFRRDLSEIFAMDLADADWAGIKAETRDEKNGVHTHFAENSHDFIFMPGFMIANTAAWRAKGMLARFEQIIREFGTRLKFFDLDILNLAADQIATIPFDYCVLKNIYDFEDITQTPEYPWLKNAYSDNDLLRAKNNPAIIHYAGQPIKIWKRWFFEIPADYWARIEQSPFFIRDYYFPCFTTKVKCALLTMLVMMTPLKRWRKTLEKKRMKCLRREEKRRDALLRSKISGGWR